MTKYIARLVAAALASLSLFSPIPLSAQAAPRSAPIIVDFDAAMKGLGFDARTLDANWGTSNAPNGILDSDEMALVAAILAKPSLSFAKLGGIDHARVRAAYLQAKASATVDVSKLSGTYPTAAEVVVGYAMLGKGSFDTYNDMSTTFMAPLKSDYSLALALGRYLAFDGDADGDGVSNLEEYRAHQTTGRAGYLKAALDPAVKLRPAATVAQAGPVAAKKQQVLGIVLYPGFEVLDVYGPLEMWAYIPDFKVVMVAEKAGPVRSAQGVSTMAEYSFETAPPLDIMMVPGGNGTFAQLKNPVFLDYLRAQHQRTQLTTSVCTGSALLAQAGILKGHKATTNKAFFKLAVEQDPTVDWQIKARWVEDGKLFTSSGVSAGTDMSLGMVAKLYGIERARALAKSLEYQWHENAGDDPFAILALPKVAKPE